MENMNTFRVDYLKTLLDKYYPLHFFATFRAHELYNVQEYIPLLQQPILDLGCGDGQIAHILFGKRLEYGLDVSEEALEIAKEKKYYKSSFLNDAHQIPLPSSSLGGIFSNCALEHIPRMPELIKELSRTLKPGAYFVATCHSPHYYTLNPYFSFCDKPHLQWVRRWMIKQENKAHHHVSILSTQEYERYFSENQMVLEKVKFYGPLPLAKFVMLWDTASKCSPLGFFTGKVAHNGSLIKYLRWRYGRINRLFNISKAEQIEHWYKKYAALCYSKCGNGEVGTSQILVARKV